MESLKYFFTPKSVAIIGASHTPAKIGYTIFENFVKGEFPGKFYPVNPDTTPILDQRVYPSITAIPGKVDLAIIAVPAPTVPKVLEECGERGVKAVIIISGGFAEIGEVEREEEIKRIGKKYGMRIIGPNCMGVFDPYNKIDTLFMPGYRLRRPKKGAISFVSQSGAFGIAAMDWAAQRNIGINKFISFGNKADVDEVDCLEFLEGDEKTKCISMYVENIKRGKEFIKVAKRVSKKKPIVCLKGGVTESGAKAVSSHTGSLAGSAKVYSAAFRQAGVLETKSIGEMFDVARVLAYQPKPNGNKIAIVTDGGAFGVMAADAAEEYGLKIADLSEELKNRLRKFVPPHALIKNPIDLTGDASTDMYYDVLHTIASDPSVDGIIAICLLQIPTISSKIVGVLTDVSRTYKKPLIVCMMGGEFTDLHMRMLEDENIPSYSTPHQAVRAMAALVEYYSIR
jgi:acetyl coenzyme A synthetase (ADP forming)-like protein